MFLHPINIPLDDTCDRLVAARLLLDFPQLGSSSLISISDVLQQFALLIIKLLVERSYIEISFDKVSVFKGLLLDFIVSMDALDYFCGSLLTHHVFPTS